VRPTPGKLTAPPLSTLNDTAPLILNELFRKQYCGGFACGNGPLQALESFAEVHGHSSHVWKPSMMKLLCEGLGNLLQMSDVAKAEKYRPRLFLGAESAHNVFLGEQAGSVMCAGYGKLDQGRYVYGGTQAALLLGGRLQHVEAWPGQDHCPFATAMATADGAAQLTATLRLPPRTAVLCSSSVGGVMAAPCAAPPASRRPRPPPFSNATMHV